MKSRLPTSTPQWRKKLVLEPGQDARFDGLPVNPARILAGATAPMSRVCEPAVTLRNIRGTTDTAAEKTGEEVLLAVRAVEGNSVRIAPYREGERLLPRLLASMPVIMSGGSRGQREDEIESGSQEAQETAIRAGETRNGYRARPSFRGPRQRPLRRTAEADHLQRAVCDLK